MQNCDDEKTLARIKKGSSHLDLIMRKKPHNQNLKIFISSSFGDLVHYREVVHAAIRRMKSHADDMIYWTADAQTPSSVCEQNVAQSDVGILILAHRYGSLVPDQTGRSFTELEYDCAMKNAIPILAFFVDPNYPWPPANIDSDSQSRESLMSFKRRVESDCVRQFFTTPESLAMLVTQALANLDLRHDNQVPIETSPIAQSIVAVQPRSELKLRSNVNLFLCEGEDGLPLVLRIERASEKELSRLFGMASHFLGEGNPAMLGIRSSITSEIERVGTATRIRDISIPDGPRRECYLSLRNMASLFAPSLLSALIGRPSGQRESRDKDNSTQMIVGALRSKSYRNVDSSGGANRFMAIPLKEDEDPLVVSHCGYDDGEKLGEFSSSRPFVRESLSWFSECVFTILDRSERRGTLKEAILAEGSLADYPSVIHHLIASHRGDDLPKLVTRFKVSRQSLLKTIRQIALEVGRLHESGWIHGDIKPQNVMLCKQHCKLIDQVGMRKDEISPVMSPGWSAPEQVTLQPVSFATDVYPLGLMIVKALSADLCGQKAAFHIPTQGESTPDVTLFVDPVPYLDPNNSIVPKDARTSWHDLISKSLRSRSSERIPDGVAFAEELDRVLSVGSIDGWTYFEMRRNECPVMCLMPDGVEQVARIIVDDGGNF